ncbi:MAG: hexokinase family protein [Desulfosudaceae bacterium]
MPFSLSRDQLLDIAGCMARDIRLGLGADNAEILAIPTYVPLDPPPETGRVLAVDVGGTNARAAVVSLDDQGRLSVDQGPVSREIPVCRGTPTELTTFLEALADVVLALNPPRDLPVGYCFSYPSRLTPDGDAEILGWTKELLVRDTIGQKAGMLLRNHLNLADPGLLGEELRVINDTVAALLAGRAETPAEAHIGLVAGTGTNMALLLPPAQVPKLADKLSWQAPLPINLESGNFHPPHLTRLDTSLDAATHNPTCQRFEKAVSGYYLPYLFLQACPESDIDPERGAAALFELAFEDKNKPSDTEANLARQIVERSARLIAAALTGAVIVMGEATGAGSVCVTAEGGLFQAHPRYRKIVESTLRELLTRSGRNEMEVQIQTVADANLKGCAIAGLARSDGAVAPV